MLSEQLRIIRHQHVWLFFRLPLFMLFIGSYSVAVYRDCISVPSGLAA